jgi:hypothetical protein
MSLVIYRDTRTVEDDGFTGLGEQKKYPSNAGDRLATDPAAVIINDQKI